MGPLHNTVALTAHHCIDARAISKLASAKMSGAAWYSCLCFTRRGRLFRGIFPGWALHCRFQMSFKGTGGDITLLGSEITREVEATTGENRSRGNHWWKCMFRQPLVRVPMGARPKFLCWRHWKAAFISQKVSRSCVFPFHLGTKCSIFN